LHCRDKNGNCAIRNKIYEKFLRDFFPIPIPISIDTNKHKKTSKSNPVASKTEEKPTVFICYSRKDEKWKDKLLPHLNVLAYQEICIPWHDKDISPGKEWVEEIRKNIDRAKAAVFLVTANSLSSYFILHDEITELLGKKDKERCF